jgi:hypothetical protein
MEKIVLIRYRSTFTIWHKLNYFLFCETFGKLFIICVEILIKSKFQLLGLTTSLQGRRLKIKTVYTH